MKYALAMIALLVFSTPVVAQQTPVAERPTWAQGDSWTYSEPGPAKQVKYTVLEVAPDAYKVEFFNGPIRNVITVDLDLHPIDSILFQFKWPLRQGTTWKRTMEGVSPTIGPVTVDITSTVEAYESVVTPAGSFETFRIKGRHCTIKANACGDFTTWYAPSAKFYVRVSWGAAYWPPPFGGNTRLLTSYQVHSP